MEYRAFTGDSLTMMYESIRAALGSDHALKAEGQKPRFPRLLTRRSPHIRRCSNRGKT